MAHIGVPANVEEKLDLPLDQLIATNSQHKAKGMSAPQSKGRGKGRGRGRGEPKPAPTAVASFSMPSTTELVVPVLTPPQMLESVQKNNETRVRQGVKGGKHGKTGKNGKGFKGKGRGLPQNPPIQSFVGLPDTSLGSMVNSMAPVDIPLGGMGMPLGSVPMSPLATLSVPVNNLPLPAPTANDMLIGPKITQGAGFLPNTPPMLPQIDSVANMEVFQAAQNAQVQAQAAQKAQAETLVQMQKVQSEMDSLKTQSRVQQKADEENLSRVLNNFMEYKQVYEQQASKQQETNAMLLDIVQAQQEQLKKQATQQQQQHKVNVEQLKPQRKNIKAVTAKPHEASVSLAESQWSQNRQNILDKARGTTKGVQSQFQQAQQSQQIHQQSQQGGKQQQQQQQQQLQLLQQQLHQLQSMQGSQQQLALAAMQQQIQQQQQQQHVQQQQQIQHQKHKQKQQEQQQQMQPQLLQQAQVQQFLLQQQQQQQQAQQLQQQPVQQQQIPDQHQKPQQTEELNSQIQALLATNPEAFQLLLRQQ
eukprot:TRINITY_DN2078_c0_g1_i2.p1 TRINITY_DN2078_c0_g1~~TRINITY_DN2078_c0_g1_i2.p1  ORF type:complete len:531 (+),score=170.41 TRINITY_DN2078_c0_g1_i2:92-1684(+)